MKTCKICELDKNIESFSKNNQQKDGRHVYCKACCSAKAKLIYFPDKYRKSVLKKVYGLSVEQWDDMFRSQNGCCAICKRHQSEFSKRLHTDHDHSTGAVRGLLCAGCNHGVGWLEKSGWAESAYDYLNKYSLKKEA